MKNITIRKNRSLDEIMNGSYHLNSNTSIVICASLNNLKELKNNNIKIDSRQQSNKVPFNNWFDVESRIDKIFSSGLDFYIGKIPHFDLNKKVYNILPLVYAPNSEIFKGNDKNWYVNLNN